MNELQIAEWCDEQAAYWSRQAGDYAQGRVNSFCDVAYFIREQSRAPVQASEARGDDAKRLDWLSADGEDRTVYIAMDERWSAQDGFACYGGDTLREAIDAAMAAHTQAGPVG